VRNLKRRSNRYKGKLLFKCFNCGRVGHFVAKYTYEKMEDNNDKDNNEKEEHNNKNKPYRHKRGKYTKKKSFYSREKNISPEKSDGYVSYIDKGELLFIAMDIKSIDK
jgi:hypothetical protein